MTSLTKAQRMTKVFALGLGAALLLLIVGRLGLSLLDLFTTTPRQLQQQNRVQITYGQIPQPKLPLADVSAQSTTLELDLVSGNFPQSTASAKVFKISNSSLSLSAQDRARAKATNLGFTVQPTQPTPSTFKWQEGARTLEINLNDQTFNLTSNIGQVSFSNRQSFNRFSPINRQASSFIQNQFKFSDLQYSSSDSPDSQFVTPVEGTWTPQSSNAVTPTNYAQITFLRQKIAELPIYSSAGKFGPISMVIIPPTIPTNNNQRPESSVNIDQIIELHNKYIPISQDDSATYPVITAQNAYTKLQQNFKSYLVNVSPINSTSAASSVNSARVQFATLVYLEPDSQNHDYVQPVWMFEGRASTDMGDARWVAYVPAIDSDLVNQLLLR